MKNRIIYTLILLTLSTSLFSRSKEVDTEYRRSSIYSILINHSDQKYAAEIKRVFLDMPTPDKYNNHDLSVKALTISTKGVSASETSVQQFLDSNYVASRLVGRWFNRNFITGECDVELIKSRGLYNANEFDKEIALRSQRGKALIEDSGEELIANTFVLVNDIVYVDKEQAAKVGGGFLRGLGAILGAVTGIDLVSDAANLAASITESLKGFKVKVTTHLYQLEWSDDVATEFYTQWYTDSVDVAKVEAFNNNRDKFRLVYVGSQNCNAKDISVMGVNLNNPDVMVRKACERALDENVADLQRNFDQFRVKIPLLSIDPITADIGMKEGITPSSKFEVLEATLDENGKTLYNRVAVISPVADKIWDNRYMAVEEGAANAKLGKTTFRKVGGKKIYAGMLIREIR